MPQTPRSPHLFRLARLELDNFHAMIAIRGALGRPLREQGYPRGQCLRTQPVARKRAPFTMFVVYMIGMHALGKL